MATPPSVPGPGPACPAAHRRPGGIEDYETNAAATDDERYQVGGRYGIRAGPWISRTGSAVHPANHALAAQDSNT